MIRSLRFDGFRSFPSRRQYKRTQSFQEEDEADMRFSIELPGDNSITPVWVKGDN